MTAWDYIVVGAGSAGCAVAGRLSEDGRSRVLVLEAGGSDRRLAITMPAASFLLALGNPRYDWAYKAEPDPTRAGRRDLMPRGKVLGGTSAINGMSYVRGQPADYDGWAAQGCQDWDFASVLPYFKRAEDNENGADAYHGTGGPLAVSNRRTLHRLSEAYLQSCIANGMSRMADINTPPQAGVGYVPCTQRRGRRWSAARAYLRPATGRRNLRVLTHAHVRRVLFEGKRATGVEYVHRGRTMRAEAARAVILSAGAFSSPQLLMLSGVGPSAHLRDRDVPVVHDLPGVGENLQDHPGLAQTCWANVSTYNMQTGLAHALLLGAQWLLAGTGPGSTPHSQVTAFARHDGGAGRSDIQYLFSPAGFDLSEDGPVLFDRPAVTGLLNVLRPFSRGGVRLASADPFAQPAIQPNLFADERDLELLLAGARLQRRIFETEPLSRFITGHLRPGSNVQSDDEWRAYLREGAMSAYHPAGTCKMGHDRMAVVDDRLRVRGLANLYVADASIMPAIVSGNLHATCVMIGEKAADLVRESR
ncbi:MAG: FAD-dependent oxidoreductase [Rhodospirillales bacterium]|nr:FAD-dependent oxidoreductase [Rhodospirillales bacterium]